MGYTRRDFLKLSASGLGLGLLSSLGLDVSEAKARVRELKISKAKVSKTLCPYCAVSCGVLAYAQTDGSLNSRSRIIHVEGNPDDPINRGSLCPKGITLRDIINSPERVKKPLYKPAGSGEWKEIGWEEAIEKFARWVKETRDKTFITKDEQGRTVNRTDSIMWYLGGTIGNEEGWLSVKIAISLGITARDMIATI